MLSADICWVFRTINTTASIFHRSASEIRTERINNNIATINSLDKALKALRRIPATTYETRVAMSQAQMSLAAAFSEALDALALEA
jgi:hypothetical protein